MKEKCNVTECENEATTQTISGAILYELCDEHYNKVFRNYSAGETKNVDA